MEQNNSEKNQFIDSSLTDSDKDQNFDIRNLMNYDLIRRSLLQYPTELALFEITCILINGRIKESLGE
jgi:hypothetical protein